MFTIAPKWKAPTAPKGGKQMKKDIPIKKECESPTIDNDSIKLSTSGKNLGDKNTNENVFYHFTAKCVLPESLDKNDCQKEVELPNHKLNQLLKEKSKISLQGTMKWKTFIFPPLPNLPSNSKVTKQYFGLDLVDEEKERPYWTHKASVWQNLFTGINDLVTTKDADPIDSAFDGILYCPLQETPNGPNENKSFMSALGKPIQMWIMLVPMPTDIDHSEYIPQFLGKLHALSKKTYIQLAYKFGVAGITKHAGLMEQVSEGGNYWHVLNNAAKEEVISQTFHSLSEILQDFTIKEIISTMFGVKKDPDTWTHDIKAYAFGN